MHIKKYRVSMIYKYVNNGSLLIKIVITFPFINISFHWWDSQQNIWKLASVNIEEMTAYGVYVFMIWAKLWFTSLILFIFCFTDFDCLRNKGFSNAIPTGTFTNISNKNMKGSRTYDHIWLTKETKNITSGNDPIYLISKILF